MQKDKTKYDVCELTESFIDEDGDSGATMDSK